MTVTLVLDASGRPLRALVRYPRPDLTCSWHFWHYSDTPWSYRREAFT